MRHSLESLIVSLIVLVRDISYQSRCLCELSFILKIGKNLIMFVLGAVAT